LIVERRRYGSLPLGHNASGRLIADRNNDAGAATMTSGQRNHFDKFLLPARLQMRQSVVSGQTEISTRGDMVAIRSEFTIDNQDSWRKIFLVFS
jgi:hypothetical protein